jgi:hypothetical protein
MSLEITKAEAKRLIALGGIVDLTINGEQCIIVNGNILLVRGTPEEYAQEKEENKV